LADAGWVYDAPYKVTILVPRSGEDRRMDIARVHRMQAVLVLVYVIRGDVLRAISLRRASKAERRFHHEKTGA